MEANLQPVETAPETAHVEPQGNERDERFVLLVGFSVGMMVAGIFLLYVVLSAAGLLK